MTLLLLKKHFDHDLTYKLERLDSVWALQLAYADLRGIFALYESFRRFQKQQTAPGRIPAPKQAWLDFTDSVLNDPQNGVQEALDRLKEVMEKNLFESVAKVRFCTLITKYTIMPFNLLGFHKENEKAF